MRKHPLLTGGLAWLLALSLAACATTAGQTPTLKAEEYYKQAQEQVAKKDYQEAKTSLEEARRHFRAGDVDAGLLALLGDVHYQLEEYTDALGVYGEFLSLHPRNPLAPRIQFQIGMCHLKQISSPDRNPLPAVQAREAFSRVLQNYPRSPEAAEATTQLETARRALAASEMSVGQFYFRKDNYPGAISRFTTVLKDYNGTGVEEEALYRLAESYRRLKEQEKAQEYFRQLVDRYPTGKYAGEARDYLEKRRG